MRTNMDALSQTVQVKIPMGYKLVDGKLISEPWTTRPNGTALTDEEKKDNITSGMLKFQKF